MSALLQAQTCTHSKLTELTTPEACRVRAALRVFHFLQNAELTAAHHRLRFSVMPRIRLGPWCTTSAALANRVLQQYFHEVGTEAKLMLTLLDLGNV